MIVLGGDAGTNGAVALVELSTGNRPHVLLGWAPLKTGRPLRYDGSRLHERVRELIVDRVPAVLNGRAVDAVFMEAALSLPRDDGKRRRNANRYGQSVGELRAALGAVTGLPVQEVQAGAWMAALGLRYSRPHGLSDDAWKRERKKRIHRDLQHRVSGMDGQSPLPGRGVLFIDPVPVYAADAVGVAVYGVGELRLRGRLSA